MDETGDVVTPEAVEQFIETGFLRTDRAFSPDLAAEGRRILWQAMGLSPEHPGDWTAPVVHVGFRADPPFVAAANTPRLHAAYDALVGAGRWQRPAGLGTFPVRFPISAPANDTGWHVDAGFGIEAADFMDWRVNILSQGRALLMLFLLSDVGERDAPTRIRLGSHARMARSLLPHGAAGMTLRQMAETGFGDSASCDEALATGPAGTVYLCHPFLVHSAQDHRGSQVRFMAQPPLLPVGGFDPALPPSAVQRAIRRACGLAGG